MSNFTTVQDKLSQFFLLKTYVIYERAKFNQRFQCEVEPVEEFITNLQKLAQTCRYGTLTDELICDRIIIGIQNFKLSERLQTYDNDLTLENTIAKVKAAEGVAENQNIVRQESANSSTVANLNF